MSHINSFMKTIGFQGIKNQRQMDQLLNWIVTNYDRDAVIPVPNADTTYVQVWKEFGNGFGISIVGELEDDEINVEYSYPYVRGCEIHEKMDLQIEKLSSREAYAGVSENVNVGVSLIFFLQNADEFLRTHHAKDYYFVGERVHLAGLASKGVVLLELNKDDEQREQEKEKNKDRNQLIEAARAGDMKAIETLTLEDMDTYTKVTRRSKREDILTIVDTYFMPYGIESDQYSILGIIYKVEESENQLTKEKIYLLSVECNNIHIRIAINREQLMGEPICGRRLKANIWLQGTAEFIRWKES